MRSKAKERAKRGSNSGMWPVTSVPSHFKLPTKHTYGAVYSSQIRGDVKQRKDGDSM